MKRQLVTLAFAAIAGFVPGAGSVHAKSADFHGHSMGEPVAAFLRSEPEARQQADACRQDSSRPGCAALLAAVDLGQRAEISTANPASMNFILDRGKLVRLTMFVDDSAQLAAAHLAKTFHQPSRKWVIPAQNNAGAKWENHLFVWETPDAYIALYEDNDPSLHDRRPLLVIDSRAQSREYIVSVKQLAAHRKSTPTDAAALHTEMH